jgi:hypothetical protein
VPEIVPVSHLWRGVLQIGRGDNVIAIEDCACAVSRDAHAHDFRDARPDEVACRGAAEIMP